MASLKEIKGRIKSVKSTQKITSAMKMISSAKLHKAQNMIENFLPYKQQLTVGTDIVIIKKGQGNIKDFCSDTFFSLNPDHILGEEKEIR